MRYIICSVKGFTVLTGDCHISIFIEAKKTLMSRRWNIYPPRPSSVITLLCFSRLKADGQGFSIGVSHKVKAT